MSNLPQDPAAYYAANGDLSDLRPYADRLGSLPATPAELVPVVQGALIHAYWLDRYGVTVSPERKKEEPNLRPIALKLRRLWELDSRPLTEARPQERRLVGTCRDFTLLLCALLRHQGVPARARCGLGTYFTPGRYEDHWVCETWNAAERRWVMVDAQLDALQRQVLNIRFDPLDLPPGAFITGGRAWQMCRAEGANPDLFGIFEWHGLGFVCGDLIRDFLALNKVEVLPWDIWGLMEPADQDVRPEDWALLDRLATLTQAGSQPLDEVRALYEREGRLHPPAEYLAQARQLALA